MHWNCRIAVYLLVMCVIVTIYTAKLKCSDMGTRAPRLFLFQNAFASYLTISIHEQSLQLYAGTDKCIQGVLQDASIPTTNRDRYNNPTQIQWLSYRSWRDFAVKLKSVAKTRGAERLQSTCLANSQDTLRSRSGH
ncbi:hypothetical protein J6590_014383 [Homalodisca vitripennis]|nr:hypothetical protein J6590_014383 [Homalodisca vitripennis]